VRTVYVIGIGAGDPEHLTLQAVAAMNRADVFFTIDKGEAKGDLAALRATVLDRHVTGPYRVVTARDPERDRSAPSGRYAGAVADWQERRAALYERMLTDELGDDDGGVAFEVVSIPGISAVQALAAAHRIALNRVGRPVTVTTGRRLADEGPPPGADDVVVMLDAVDAFAALPGDDGWEIFWGAYLGTPDEALVHGPLQQVKAEIVRRRAELRARKGWIMDTYLLRRRLR
jgi:precorrin-6A synthase